MPKSIIDEETAISVIAVLKKELSTIECTLLDYAIAWTATGFEIRNVKIRCANQAKVLGILRGIKTIPGQAQLIPSLFNSMTNTYCVSAILSNFRKAIEYHLGLTTQAAGYANDIPILTVMPTEPKEPEPELPELPDLPDEISDEEMPEIPDLPEDEAGEPEELAVEKPEGAAPEEPAIGDELVDIDTDTLGI